PPTTALPTLSLHDALPIFFGDGPLKEDLARRIAERNLTGRFVLGGFRTDLEKLLPGLDLAVLSSHTEGLPVAVLEAQAAGVPVRSEEHTSELQSRSDLVCR